MAFNTPSFQIEIADWRALNQRLAKAPRAVTLELRQAVAGAARLVRDQARELIRAGGRAAARSRRIAPGVRLTVRFGRNPSSAPGAPPAQQTGALLRSIRTRAGSRSGLSVLVVAEFYGRFLEFGARDAARNRTIAPRPFFAPALDRQAATIAGMVAAGLDRALEKL